jgi:uncharacterized protein YecT (DUF1311 family)
MRKSLYLAALAISVGIGGTGHAAPNAVPYAYNVDHGTPTHGRCEAIAGADRDACRKLEALVADANRNAALGTLSRNWTGTRLSAFARLVAAEQAFAASLAINETGAAPGSREAMDAEQAEKDVFVSTVQRLVAGELSRGDGSAEASDEALNDAYGQVMKIDDPRELGWGDVDKAGILRTERAWIVYRDAFASFAQTLEGPDAAETIKWELTRQRTATLDAFLGD